MCGQILNELRNLLLTKILNKIIVAKKNAQMNPNKNYIIFNKGKQSMHLKQHSSGFFFLVSRNLI